MDKLSGTSTQLGLLSLACTKPDKPSQAGSALFAKPDISSILLLAEYISTKPLLDQCQLYAIARRVHFGQTIA